jgi:O-antigen ligase
MKIGLAAAAKLPVYDVRHTGLILLLVYQAMEFSRALSLLPVLATLRVQMLVLIALLYQVYRARAQLRLNDPVVVMTLMFAVLCGMGTLYAPNTRTAFNMMNSILIYLSAGMLAMQAFAATLPTFRRVIVMWVLSSAFVGAYATLHGGAGPSGFLADENDCALFLNVALPFAVALAIYPGASRWQRLIYWFAAFLVSLGSVTTLSRGGFLGMVAAGLVAFVFSRRKLKVLLVLLAISVPLAIVAPILMPKNYVSEIESINDPQDTTRLNRIYFWGLGWTMYKENPVIGVGAGNYPWTVNIYEDRLPPEEVYRGNSSAGRPCHSVYFTLLSELGTVGTGLFVLLVIAVVRCGLRMRRNRVPDELERRSFALMGGAILASCAAFVVSGAFISVLYYPVFWFLAAIAMAGATACGAGPRKVAKAGSKLKGRQRRLAGATP